MTDTTLIKLSIKQKLMQTHCDLECPFNVNQRHRNCNRKSVQIICTFIVTNGQLF